MTLLNSIWTSYFLTLEAGYLSQNTGKYKRFVDLDLSNDSI